MNKHPLLADDRTADLHRLIAARRILHEAIIKLAEIQHDEIRLPFIEAVGSTVDQIDQYV